MGWCGISARHMPGGVHGRACQLLLLDTGLARICQATYRVECNPVAWTCQVLDVLCHLATDPRWTQHAHDVPFSSGHFQIVAGPQQGRLLLKVLHQAQCGPADPLIDTLQCLERCVKVLCSFSMPVEPSQMRGVWARILSAKDSLNQDRFQTQTPQGSKHPSTPWLSISHPCDIPHAHPHAAAAAHTCTVYMEL
jgi:hypothetical protein